MQHSTVHWIRIQAEVLITWGGHCSDIFKPTQFFFTTCASFCKFKGKSGTAGIFLLKAVVIFHCSLAARWLLYIQNRFQTARFLYFFNYYQYEISKAGLNGISGRRSVVSLREAGKMRDQVITLSVYTVSLHTKPDGRTLTVRVQKHKGLMEHIDLAQAV